jgi:hypothetical protein
MMCHITWMQGSWQVVMENCCLRALHEAKLVTEHIETRPLFNPLYPNLEQGKVAYLLLSCFLLLS